VEVYRKFGGYLPVAVTVNEETNFIGNDKDKAFQAVKVH
jgi:hypothetical protein